MPLVNGKYLYPHPEHPRKLVTRARLWQLKKRDAGKCPGCGGPRKKLGSKNGKPLFRPGLCDICVPRKRKNVA